MNGTTVIIIGNINNCWHQAMKWICHLVQYRFKLIWTTMLLARHHQIGCRRQNEETNGDTLRRMLVMSRWQRLRALQANRRNLYQPQVHSLPSTLFPNATSCVTRRSWKFPRKTSNTDGVLFTNSHSRMILSPERWDFCTESILPEPVVTTT